VLVVYPRSGDCAPRRGDGEPFRDYAALDAGLDAVVRRQEAWALTKIGRAVVAAVRCPRLGDSWMCRTVVMVSTARNRST
jgi:hypothetical protein